MKTLTVGWRDIDGVGHMANTAYLDKAADVRATYMAEQDYPAHVMLRSGLGPIIMRDEVDYRRESVWCDQITVTWDVAGLSADGSHWIARHEFSRDGKFLARVQSTGGFLDLRTRTLATPPPEFEAIFASLARTDDFVELPSLIRRA